MNVIILLIFSFFVLGTIYYCIKLSLGLIAMLFGFAPDGEGGWEWNLEGWLQFWLFMGGVALLVVLFKNYVY